MTQEELGRRLRRARERAGITQGEAGQALDLDDTAVAKIERGRRRVGALELKRLTSLYRVPVEDLLEDNPSEFEAPLEIALRANAATLGPKAEAMKRRLQRIVADDRWLREDEGEEARFAALSATTIPDNVRGFHRGYEVAERFRDRYGLGASPIADVAILADEVGVVVARMPLGNDFDSPDGCSAVDPDTDAPYILINSNKPRVRRRFTIAHELGHLALGHLLNGQVIVDETVGRKSPEEKQANAFAAGLLMPAEGVQGAVKRLRIRLEDPPKPLDWIVWLAASFGVSEQAAAYRLANLRLIRDVGGSTAPAVQEMAENVEMTREAWARLGLSPVTADAERGANEVGPSMTARVARALSQGAISVEGAAGMLHQPTDAVYRWVAESGLHLGVTEGPSSRPPERARKA
jgi:Zn-dependent peptidase ImmA (M78 family)/transcriptional regulator with XRE-family HTH domain